MASNQEMLNRLLPFMLRLKPEIKLVSIQGVAGTGKTLLALAAALEQKKEYKQIYLARPIVPLSNKDIGYLPGDIKSKVNPYMEPLWDNLKFIQNQYSETDKEYFTHHRNGESGKTHDYAACLYSGSQLVKHLFYR